MKRKVAVTLMVWLLASCAEVFAQRAHFGPQVGFYDATDADNSRAMIGLALRLRLSAGFGLEGSVNYRQEDYGGGSVTVRSWPVMITALLYPIPPVYGAIGAGWYNTSFTYHQERYLLFRPEDEKKQEFGWHFGGGLELPVGRNARLIGDIRYVFLNYDFQRVPGSAGLSSDFYVITVGLLFGI
jgi:hypothetical protein